MSGQLRGEPSHRFGRSATPSCWSYPDQPRGAYVLFAFDRLVVAQQCSGCLTDARGCEPEVFEQELSRPGWGKHIRKPQNPHRRRVIQYNRLCHRASQSSCSEPLFGGNDSPGFAGSPHDRVCIQRLYDAHVQNSSLYTLSRKLLGGVQSTSYQDTVRNERDVLSFPQLDCLAEFEAVIF